MDNFITLYNSNGKVKFDASDLNPDYLYIKINSGSFDTFDVTSLSSNNTVFVDSSNILGVKIESQTLSANQIQTLQNKNGTIQLATENLADLTNKATAVKNITTIENNDNENILLTAADGGKIIYCRATNPITITMPTTDPGDGWSAMFIQAGAGQITFAAGSGNTLNSYGSLLKTAGQHASASIVRVASQTYNLGGTLA